jgi:hypothetical protein
LWKKKKESLDTFSHNEREYIHEYFKITQEIDFMEKEIENKIEKNLDNGLFTLKLHHLEELQKRKNHLDEYFVKHPRLLNYLSSFNDDNAQLN